ncbi:hypothetical protein BpHYR1_012547 [Brachionus plicatilis]|uniref:Uncharacterized protein n=1 Tax=Brachionus plicatilis TaxID=10195 RepID=A0A3M7PIU9_BRAPC|nr:hypothetical protein BpHYR1_012547 [Brachionus plicatilis]
MIFFYQILSNYNTPLPFYQKSSKYLCSTGRMFKPLSSLKWGYRFRLGNNSGVDDQLDAVTSVSSWSRCSKRMTILKLKIIHINYFGHDRFSSSRIFEDQFDLIKTAFTIRVDTRNVLGSILSYFNFDRSSPISLILKSNAGMRKDLA